MQTFQDIKTYFESLSWAANIMAFMPLFGAGFWIYKKQEKIVAWFGRRKPVGVKDYMAINSPNYIFENKSVKIVVIDDNPDDFPLDYLRNTFGQVTVFDKISLSEASRLIGYDLIFLDMMGVVKEDPKYGGLQLIKKIKGLPDAPIVVAVSGARFDPTASNYFEIADDVLKKPLTEMKCEEVVLELVKEKMSPFRAADTIDSEILGKSKNDREKNKINALVFSYLDGKITLDALRADLLNSHRHIDTSLVISKVQRVKGAYGP
ncbi:response regulator [Massilia sp. KIM]|uniref:response regulator n=1 Tax=Massilia sp. KIM TaxID=1955422 RepID=UPI001181002A|nr:response regulator [Massilia sp. KIM]